jgi:uncharacterized protein YbjQ (UPF0145 family)
MDSKKFAYHPRTLLKHNAEQRIISNESLEKSVETLKAEAIVAVRKNNKGHQNQNLMS